MRLISTLLFLFIAVSVTAQSANADKVVVINCWSKQKIVDTVPKAIICKCHYFAKGDLTGKVNGLSIAEKKDTVKIGIACKVGEVNVQKKDSGVFASKRMGCNGYRSLTGNSQPMLAINGIPTPLGSLSKIDPNDIQSVEVLRSAPATALYGPDGVNGALLLTIKKANKFIIKDFTDGDPVPGATILFTSLKDRNEKFQLIADDSGIVTTKKMNRSGRYEITVSAIGHITTQQVIETNSGNEKEIFLNRDIKNCTEVIVSLICKGRKPETLYCKLSGMYVTAGTDEKKPVVQGSLRLALYPNPVQSGASLNLQFDNTGEKEKIVRVLTFDGKVLLQQVYSASQGKNIFRLPTEARWPAGTYLVQLLYENGRVLASEKMIIR